MALLPGQKKVAVQTQLQSVLRGCSFCNLHPMLLRCIDSKHPVTSLYSELTGFNGLYLYKIMGYSNYLWNAYLTLKVTLTRERKISIGS